MPALLELSLDSFIDVAGHCEPHLTQAFERRFGYKPSPAERRSWTVSLPALASALQPLAGSLDGAVVLLELQMPG